jgi:hypothetical protein
VPGKITAMTSVPRVDELSELLDGALRAADDSALRSVLLSGSRLPGARLNLGLVDAFGQAAGAEVSGRDARVDALEWLLDGWAALGPGEAPGDQPAVVLPCAAVAAYGALGAARPDWLGDEMGKLRRAAGDARWRVREVVARAVQRLLDADWSRTFSVLVAWASDDDPLVARAAAAAVAEPRLLHDPLRATSAHSLQRVVVDRYRSDPQPRSAEASRVLRQGLAFTVSVTVAATADFGLLVELASSDDADLRWIATQNLKKSRLARWPENVDRVRSLLGADGSR